MSTILQMGFSMYIHSLLCIAFMIFKLYKNS
uniref:Uncharacterized protein n=1 Tax=Podoviridae sp. ct8Lf7 TaxID=2827723 RepID=A0A8S5S1B5_9CAUD|nr:MAG TPA: hypothetical protein [Podoviridae sp. ct8Lf7]